MPTGPRRFGCGEIATGFKSGGFPPGFFNYPRIVPRPPGDPGTPGGGNGGGPPCPGCPWKCIQTIDTCANLYGANYECRRPVTPLEPCVAKVKCEEQPAGTCLPNGVDCFNTEAECKQIIGNTGCRNIDDCVKKSSQLEYHCYEHQYPCTQTSPVVYGYTRRCERCSSSNVPGVPSTLPDCNGTIYNSEAACQSSCQHQECPPIIPVSTTPITGLPYSCVEDTSNPKLCRMPGPGSNGITVEIKGVKCTPCNCLIQNGVRVCTPNGVPVAGTQVCSWPGSLSMCHSDPACKAGDCPEVIMRGKCYEHKREKCTEGGQGEEYKVINKCQSCKCWTDPTTNVEKCYRQQIFEGNPVGEHRIEDECPLAACQNTSEECPDVDCVTISIQTEAGNIFA